MNIRYLCKKHYAPEGKGIEIKYGEVIGIEFDARKPKICTIYRGGRSINVMYKIPETDLAEYFYLYDDIETIDTPTALTLLEWKIKNMTNERRMLNELQYYINTRHKFLNLCSKEDTQQEQQ